MVTAMSEQQAKHIFDQLDRDLISLLRHDGRAPLSKLADILHVSRGTVQNRLDRLMESGAILGYTVRVREDYELDGIRAIMLIDGGGKIDLTGDPQIAGHAGIAHLAHNQRGLGSCGRNSGRFPVRF